MSDPFVALVPFGWSDRVRALWSEFDGQPVRPARVVRVERGVFLLVGEDGVEHPARSAEPVAVGDWVAVADGSIRAVLPRWSEVSRMDPARSGAQAGVQVLAANVDLVVVAAPVDRLSAARVERELAVAWESGALPVVALTKTDLDGHADGRHVLAERLVGVDVLPTSACDGTGIERLRTLLSGRTGLLFGPSGAGKSSLVNALVGARVQNVAEVRDADGRGRHTTTSRQLVCVPGGGVVIDTPGLRSLAIAGGAGVDEVFPEIEVLASECRFRNCRHDGEPGCAVVGAVETGSLDPARLASFRKLEREVERERRLVDPIARRVARRAWARRAQDARRHDKRRLG